MSIVYKHEHINDEDAIAYACGELSAYRKFNVREQVRKCAECLARLQSWQNFCASHRRVLSPLSDEQARMRRVGFLYLDEIAGSVEANHDRPYRVGFLVEGGLFYQDQYSKAVHEKDENIQIVDNDELLSDFSEALGSMRTPVVLSSSPRAWSRLRADILPHKECTVPLANRDREELQRQGQRCYVALSDNSEIWATLEWIMLFGVFDVLTPLCVLGQIAEVSIDSLRNRLQSAMPVLFCQSDRHTITTLDNAEYIAVRSDIIARVILETVRLWDTKALTEKLSAALASILVSNDQPVVNFVFRLLNSLVLNSRRNVALDIVRSQGDQLQTLQDAIIDARCINAWAKMYRKLNHPYGNMKAKQLYERGLAIESENVYLLNAYASFLADQRKYTMAERRFRTIQQLGGLDNIYVLTAWADMLLKQGIHLEDARGLLEKACELEPGNPYPLQMLGLLDQRRVYFAPVTRAEDFQKGLDDSEAYLCRALEVDKDNVPSLHALGHLARERGHLQKSEVWLVKVLELDPDNVQSMVELGRIYTERAKDYMDKATMKAINYFHRVLGLDEDNALALTAWADLDIKIGQFEEAKRKLQRAEEIEVERNEPTAVVETTRVKLELKQELISEDRKRRIIQLLDRLSGNSDPAVRLVSRNLLVKVYWMAGDTQSAESLFYDILSDSFTPRVINNFAALLAWEARQQQDQSLFSQADEQYRFSLSCDLENAHTHLGYGMNLLRWVETEHDESRQEKGEQSIRKAESLGLDIPEVQYAMSRIETG